MNSLARGQRSAGDLIPWTISQQVGLCTVSTSILFVDGTCVYGMYVIELRDIGFNEVQLFRDSGTGRGRGDLSPPPPPHF